MLAKRRGQSLKVWPSGSKEKGERIRRQKRGLKVGQVIGSKVDGRPLRGADFTPYGKKRKLRTSRPKRPCEEIRV